MIEESNIIFTGKESDKKYWSVAEYDGPVTHIRVTNRITRVSADAKTKGSLFKLHDKLIAALEAQELKA